MTSEIPSSLEIPKDWVRCLVVSDIETLGESDATKDHAIFVDLGPLQLGEARISRKDLADPASFERQILSLLASSRPPILQVNWMNQEQSDRDDDEEPERDRLFAKKRRELLEVFSRIRKGSEE